MCPQWKALSKNQQEKYYEEYRRLRRIHNQLYPDWSAKDNYVSSLVPYNSYMFKLLLYMMQHWGFFSWHQIEYLKYLFFVHREKGGRGARGDLQLRPVAILPALLLHGEIHRTGRELWASSPHSSSAAVLLSTDSCSLFWFYSTFIQFYLVTVNESQSLLVYFKGLGFETFNFFTNFASKIFFFLSIWAFVLFFMIIKHFGSTHVVFNICTC